MARRPALALLVLVIAMTAVLGPASPGAAQNDAVSTTPDAAAQQLADRFAPVMMLKQQEADCDAEGEPYRPGSVDIILDNPEVALRQLGSDNPVVTWAPSAADLAGLGAGFFLDFPGSALEPGCIYETDFWKYTGDAPATVYAHIVRPPNEPDLLVLQYWFYWYYNDWNNKHESDWEGIALLFNASSVEEALTQDPIEVGYSQHEGGERSDWNDDKLERDGDRPFVYSSAGSHASYFDSAVFLGRGASEGFGCDDTRDPSERVDPEVVVLPDQVRDPNDPLAWLSFTGRWGERQSGPFNGPTGPAVKDRWLDPMPWFDELRDSSVVIPAGDTDAASVVGVFCDVVEFGSRTLITFNVSPTSVILAALLLAGIARWFLGRTDWTLTQPEPIRIRRRGGQAIRTAASMYRRTPVVYIAIGLLYVPAVIFTGLLARLLEFIPLAGKLLELTAGADGTNLIVAIMVGSFANAGAAVAVNAIVADYLDESERGLGAAKAAALRIWARRTELVSAYLRSFVIVSLLLLSFVGIPWAIRQLVRYQLMPQSVAFDEVGGAAALRRSSELVEGRWFHTGIMVAAVNGLVALTALLAALLVLVLATGIPLWAFSIVVALTYAVTVPLGAITLTLIYGDAVAEKENDNVNVVA